MINKSITLQFILLATISIIVSTLLTGFMGYNAADNVVIEKLKTSDLKNIVLVKSGIISIRLHRAIESSEMLAEDPLINKWFLSNEQDFALGNLAKEKLTQVTKLHDYSTVFAINNFTKHYWLHNNILSYTISESDPKDSWYFKFINSKNRIEFNLDTDKFIGKTQIFINVLMGNPDKPVGIAGVALTVTDIANDFSKVDKYNGKTWLIDDKGIVKISNNPEELGVQFDTIIGEEESNKILDNAKEINVFDFENKTGKMFLAHAPIEGTNWIVVYTVSYSSMTSPLITIKLTTIISGLVSVILVVFTFYFVSHRFTRPIRELTKVAELIASGDLDKRYITKSKNEVGVLANAFNKMTENLQESNERLKEYNQTLEQKVSQRTQELSETLKEVNLLKEQQDGDYFLTSLITSPLFKNFNKSSTTKTEFIMKQKKHFAFRKKQGDLGGDICLTGNLSFNGKRYTLFTNADAMGKSMQGASGAIVFGTVLNSILSRSASNKKDLQMEPILWLTDVFTELNTVFLTFDGSMLVSCIIGLVEDETGKMYYFNAEHPHTVIYRDNCASFLEESISVQKLGTIAYPELKIATYYLQPGDVLIAGSDGRDDILIPSESGEKTMNEDENAFIRIVEKGNGNLQQIYEELFTVGDQFDDLSLICVEYTGDVIQSKESKPDIEFIKNLLRESKFEKALQSMGNFSELEGTSLTYYRALCLDRLGRGKDALFYLDKALEQDPANVNSLRLLGHIHSRAGRYVLANQYLLRASRVEPENKKIQEALAKIKSREAGV